MAIEIAAGAVVVLGGPRVGMPGEDWASRNGTPASKALGDRGVAQRVRADVTRVPAAFAIRATMR